MKDCIPTEEEFDTILLALDYYKVRAKEMASNEEVLRATARMTKKAMEPNNVTAFEAAFSLDGNSAKGLETFMVDLVKEMDLKAVAKAAAEANNQLTLLSAKILKMRDQFRKAFTDSAISSLLNP